LKELFHITATDNKEILQPVLSIRIGERHCCFSIVDLANNELRQLAYYTAEELNENFLTDLFAAHKELNGKFSQVLICSDHPQSSFVPQKYFKQEDAGLLLKTLYGVNNYTIVSEAVPEWQLYNIYGVPKDVSNWMSRKFSAARYFHQYTVGIKNMSIGEAGGNLLVNFRNEDFTVLGSKNNKLLMTQTFLYSTPADVIYYLIKICQQFDLSQQELHLGLSGLIDKESTLYRELYQYFLNVKFLEANWIIPASANNETPAHFFTSLNDLSRCAL
jgi:hypothetical protein